PPRAATGVGERVELREHPASAGWWLLEAVLVATANNFAALDAEGPAQISGSELHVRVGSGIHVSVRVGSCWGDGTADRENRGLAASGCAHRDRGSSDLRARARGNCGSTAAALPAWVPLELV